MSTAAFDRIVEEIRGLTPDERHKLLEIIEREQRAELVRGFRGKYASLGVSTEDVEASKIEEVELEERRIRG